MIETKEQKKTKEYVCIKINKQKLHRTEGRESTSWKDTMSANLNV